MHQEGTISYYFESFEQLLNKFNLTLEYAVSCFLAGLKHETQMPVRMFNTKTLYDAYSLAKLQEATLTALYP